MLSDILNDLDIDTRLKGKTVLLVGASGFIGSEIGLHLTRFGCTIRGIDNSSPDGRGSMPYPCQYTYWDHSKPIPVALGFGVDVIINAAGVSMIKVDWTPENCQAIIDSRVEITKHCVNLANFHKIPILFQMSWTGYYGDTMHTWTNESFPPGETITAKWCAAWEYATCGLRLQNTRLVIARCGAVLSTTGGVLMELVDRYMLGIGASLRHHELYMSWIHIEDFLSFVSHALSDDSFSGIYNVCSQNPVTYSVVHREMHHYYPKGVTFSIPTPVIKAAAGEKAKLVLQSSRIYPKRLIERNFVFKHSSFAESLKDLLSYKIIGLAHTRDRFFFPKPRREVYSKFAEVKNWVHLYPGSINLSIAEASSSTIREGLEVGYRIRYRRFSTYWKEKVLNCDPGHAYQVVQLYGPFTIHETTRTFTEVGGGTLYDRWQRYQLPYGALLNFISYKRIKKVNEMILKHQRHLFKEWFGLTSHESEQSFEPSPNSDKPLPKAS